MFVRVDVFFFGGGEGGGVVFFVDVCFFLFCLRGGEGYLGWVCLRSL